MDCRSNLTKSYVAAVVAGDISAVPLATDLAFVENVMRLEAGAPDLSRRRNTTAKAQVASFSRAATSILPNVPSWLNAACL